MMIFPLILFFLYGFIDSWQTSFGSPSKREDYIKIIEAVEKVKSQAKYPESEDELFDKMLDSMLESLDPHSNYFSQEEFKEIMEDQEGHFFGIGVLISKPSSDSPILVVNPLQGTPACKAGLKSGDLIVEVEGKSTEKMNIREAVKLLKGPKGSKVRITVRRGEDEPFQLTLERDEIPKNSLLYSFLIDDIGYIRLSYFGDNTCNEIENALNKLNREGMKSLILDLRDNHGGSLKAAIEVSSLFLGKGLPVVTVRPRSGMGRVFYSEGCKEYCNLPLAVLINMGSASASEIVAGALKDHGRAVIVGTRSWGKGLVQTVTPLMRGAISLTTAYYFTPDNKNIQRSYASREEYYFPEINEENQREGGIEPDYMVNLDTIPSLASKLEFKRLYLNFLSNSKQLEIFKQGDDARILSSFKDYIISKKVEFTEEEWKESEKYILNALRREFYTLTAGIDEGYKSMIPFDKQLQKAIEILKEVKDRKVA